jgi:hypothetical protein
VKKLAAGGNYFGTYAKNECSRIMNQVEIYGDHVETIVHTCSV